MTATLHFPHVASRTCGDRLRPVRAGLAGGLSLLGSSHGFSFNAIGNRLTATVNGRAASYSPNESTQRTVPGAFDLLGEAAPAATVTVNNQPTTRQAGLFSWTSTAANALAPAYSSVNIVGATQNAGPNGEDAVTEASGKVFVARTPEVFTHDEDGNLTGDGRWTYTWDAENRLATMETQPAAVTAGVPRTRLEFTYDARHRRIQKVVRSGWTGTTYPQSITTRFLYDEGWNPLAEYEAAGNGPSTLTRSYLWSLDLSGTRQGAGGIGGLLAIRQHTGTQAGTCLPLYDGHGNVTGLLQATNGLRTATYEYGPFGETLRATGPMAQGNPFRFSTKYTDNETALLYYGYRYYQPQKGRWLSRDPAEESDGPNIYAFVKNTPLTLVDRNGRQSWGPPFMPPSGNTPPANPSSPFWSPPSWERAPGSPTVTVKKCNIVIFIGHNNTVPQGTINNEPCSAAHVISCGGAAGGDNWQPGQPQTGVPGAPENSGPNSSATVDMQTAARLLRQSVEAAKKTAAGICQDKKMCCKEVLIDVESSIGVLRAVFPYYGPWSVRVPCNR